ncbi:Na+/H+ antiporter NhaA [Helicobacter muridarum]|uniref:Na(+)/H(+) antiporter NhaA n=1 Tax=Helicobacter muridarum TaxID=216 RepID=A0A377PT29_9HELI|nr:Na+/H+ antiporter NhaA [Helicobacter muridarum]TLD98778.1 Na+/H+ antiporter NhaA [Helicobacter muridarum]STQ85451.1 putative sodium/proton antiporter [Helicobacter muridarum]
MTSQSYENTSYNNSDERTSNSTLKNFITHESFGGVLLFFAVVFAMIIANTNFGVIYNEIWNMYLDFSIGGYKLIHISVLHFINDVLMSFFFLMVGLEMKREVLYGELAGFKSVSFSVFGAIGGLIIPSIIYIYFNYGTESTHGFGVAMSTDTAFALGVLLLLGNRIPNVAKIFLVTLAVADDLGAITVIAVFYTEQINWFFIYLGMIFLIILIVFNYMDVKYISLYFAVGILLWLCLFFSGVHATVGAVVLAFTIPGKSQISRHSYLGLKVAYNKLYFQTQADFTTFEPLRYEETNRLGSIIYGFKDFFKSSYRNIKNFISPKTDAEREIDMHKEHQKVEILDTVARYSRYAQNPLVRIEFILQPLNAYFIVPLFAFANAGVPIGGALDFNIDGIFYGVILGLVIGKPIGIFTFTLLSEKLRIAKRPAGLTNAHILSTGFLAGIGFTMSMFVANLAYKSHLAIDLAKISILAASCIAAIIGIVSLLIATNKKDSDIQEEF